MKILHLFSDWKWTGPAEPVLHLCKNLEGRGHDVLLAYRRPPVEFHESIERFVRERNVRATDRFALDRYFGPAGTLRDVATLPGFMRRGRFDVVNVHLSHDHFFGAAAARLGWPASAVVRTDHRAGGIRPHPWNRFLLGRLADGVMTFSRGAANLLHERFGLAPGRIGVVEPAVDCTRFDPRRAYGDVRPLFGLDAGDVVAGMVARYQAYRKTSRFLEALAQARRRCDRLTALLVGHSSQIEESVHEPARRLGIAEHVRTPGYRSNDYDDALACVDMYVMLMAGSDGTGRALREAMALGKPVVVSRHGILPELVEDGVSGFVVGDDVGELADRLALLANDAPLRERMGARARQVALARFDLAAQAAAVEAFYERVVARRRGRAP